MLINIFNTIIIEIWINNEGCEYAMYKIEGSLIALTSTDKKPDPGLILLIIFIVAWVLLVLHAISQGRYMSASCILYCFIPVTLNRLSSLVKFHLHPFIQWGYLFMGVALLFLQFGYQDLNRYTQIANVLFILLGCWGVWSFGKKK